MTDISISLLLGQIDQFSGFVLMRKCELNCTTQDQVKDHLRKHREDKLREKGVRRSGSINPQSQLRHLLSFRIHTSYTMQIVALVCLLNTYICRFVWIAHAISVCYHMPESSVRNWRTSHHNGYWIDMHEWSHVISSLSIHLFSFHFCFLFRFSLVTRLKCVYPIFKLHMKNLNLFW